MKNKIKLFLREDDECLIAVFPDGRIAKVGTFNSALYLKFVSFYLEPCYSLKTVKGRKIKNEYRDCFGKYET